MVLANKRKSVYLQERISTLNNHQERLAYHLRAIIILMWANALLTAKTLLVILRFISMHLSSTQL
jgi:hypothetical protein